MLSYEIHLPNKSEEELPIENNVIEYLRTGPKSKMQLSNMLHNNSIIHSHSSLTRTLLMCPQIEKVGERHLTQYKLKEVK